MSRYVVNDAAFDLPDLGFVDRTTHRLERFLPETSLDDPQGQAKPFVLRVQRAPIPKGKTLADIVADHLRDANIHVRGLRVIHRRDAEVAGCPAIETAAEWRGDSEMKYTRQAHLAIGDTWVVLSASASNDERDACDALMNRAIETFRVRG